MSGKKQCRRRSASPGRRESRYYSPDRANLRQQVEDAQLRLTKLDSQNLHLARHRDNVALLLRAANSGDDEILDLAATYCFELFSSRAQAQRLAAASSHHKPAVVPPGMYWHAASGQLHPELDENGRPLCHWCLKHGHVRSACRINPQNVDKIPDYDAAGAAAFLANRGK